MSIASKSLVSFLFKLLLQRDLSDNEYQKHFSELDITAVFKSIILSPEYCAISRTTFSIKDEISCILPIPDFTPLQSKEPSIANDTLISAIVRPVNEQNIGNEPSIVIPLGVIPSDSNYSKNVLRVRNSEDRLILLGDYASNEFYQELNSGCHIRCSMSDSYHFAGIILGNACPSNDSLDIKHIDISLHAHNVDFRLSRWRSFSALHDVLLKRPLGVADFITHYSNLSIDSFASILLSSDECVAKSVFESLTMRELYNLSVTTYDVTTLFPRLCDHDLYILMSVTFGNTDALSIAIRLDSCTSMMHSAIHAETLSTQISPIDFIPMYAESSTEYAAKAVEIIHTVMSITGNPSQDFIFRALLGYGLVPLITLASAGELQACCKLLTSLQLREAIRLVVSESKQCLDPLLHFYVAI